MLISWINYPPKLREETPFSEYEIESEKIIEWGSSYIGITDHPVWPLVLKNYIAQSKQKPSLQSREEIFDELLKMHQSLKDKYYLVNEVDEDDSFESSRFESLIINSYGIFKTYHLRSIQQFINFAAIDSGSSYALGAIKAVYDLIDDPEEIAKIGIEAAVRFDHKTDLPIQAQCINLE